MDNIAVEQRAALLGWNINRCEIYGDVSRIRLGASGQVICNIHVVMQSSTVTCWGVWVRQLCATELIWATKTCVSPACCGSGYCGFGHNNTTTYPAHWLRLLPVFILTQFGSLVVEFLSWRFNWLNFIGTVSELFDHPSYVTSFERQCLLDSENVSV